MPTEAVTWTVDDLEVVENPANVLSNYVSWTTSAPFPTRLDVDCGNDYRVTFEDAKPRTTHEVYVMGLFPGARCALVARARDGAHEASAETTLSVPSAPRFLPELEVTALDETRVQPGWTLVNLNRAYEVVQPLSVALIDEKGRYRWYHQRATSEPGNDNDVRVVPGGVLIGARPPIYPAIVNWESSVAWEGDFGMHHHISPFGTEGQFLYLTDSSTDCDTNVEAGVVVHYDWRRDERLWVWRMCQHITPEAVEPDWSHLNTIEPLPDGRHILVSSRNQSQIYKIDMQTSEVVWTWGYGGDFEMNVDDLFWMQHSPEVQPNGNILVYDNGWENLREHSRVVEYRLDEEAMTAQVVWSFRPDPDIFTKIWGDADRLENGNTLVTMGQRDAVLESHLIEATPEGTEAWHVVSPPKWGWYRADRVTELPTGWVIKK